jgi:shikimate kinase/3-dehydroquinate synthase
MRVSVILGHPRQDSFNHAIADTVVGTLQRNGHSVDFHDLYTEGFDPITTHAELPKGAPLDPVVRRHCEEIAGADGIVVVHPNWWGQPPAILKGWVDRVLRPGVAYEFAEGDSGEGVPIGLLKARVALVFNTSNTPEQRELEVFGDPLERLWRDCIFDLCGVEAFYRRMYRVIVTSTPEQRQAWLEDVAHVIQEHFDQSNLQSHSTGETRMTNIAITGFMGTGKSAVGEEVARRLGWPFVDMDDVIVERAGKSIPRIFAENGERAFRALESQVCADLSAQAGLVIATGGGALVNADNRRVMMRGGTVVCLNADPDEILRRVGDDDGRPLLNVPDPRARIAELLDVRRAAYQAIPWQIETTGLSVEQVAEGVITLSDVVTLPVRHPMGEYPIHIGEDILPRVGGALRAAGALPGTTVAVVSNTVVAPLYGEQVVASLQAAGFAPFICTIPDGEQHKTLDTVRALYDQFLANDLDRGGTVLALGGGVTGDVAGFAAASFMRGVRFAQVPTTLLAMTDASVGGKTGVDLPQGKNLVGAFKQPEMVFIDLAVLETLPVEEVRAGMAEVIKHGVIGAPELFAELEMPNRSTERSRQSLQSPISIPQLARSIRVKIDVVEEDPFEGGRRAVLNLGHTTAHGLERLSGFGMRHGEAVGIGMVAAARIADTIGLADPALTERIEAALAAWGLPTACPSFDQLRTHPYDANAIYEAMAHDKKKRGNALRWVLPRRIGAVKIVENVPRDVVLTTLRELGAS